MICLACKQFYFIPCECEIGVTHAHNISNIFLAKKVVFYCSFAFGMFYVGTVNFKTHTSLNSNRIKLPLCIDIITISIKFLFFRKKKYLIFRCAYYLARIPKKFRFYIATKFNWYGTSNWENFFYLYFSVERRKKTKSKNEGERSLHCMSFLSLLFHYIALL